MSLLDRLKRAGPSGFGYSSTAEEVCAGLDLAGKTILITGVNSGLGLESARVLGRHGAHLIGLARTRDKAVVALAAIAAQGTPIECDLSDPGSVRTAVQTVRALGRPLDVLLANAGIMALPTLKQMGGYEVQFFTNHIGHFILVTGLLDVLSQDARVVVLSSAAHSFSPKAGIEFDNLSGEKGYSPWTAYGQSKLANLLFARTLAKRFEGTARTANAVHPGVIATNLLRHMSPLYHLGVGAFGWIAMKSIGQGAATECYVAVHPDARGVNGQYWKDCNISRSSTLGRDDALAERLWRESERIARESAKITTRSLYHEPT